jgi:hypothetical protein
MLSCQEKVPCTTKAKYSKGMEVKMKASNFGKKAIVTDVFQNEDCSYTYQVTYFTIWDTRRIKVVTEYEIE